MQWPAEQGIGHVVSVITPIAADAVQALVKW